MDHKEFIAIRDILMLFSQHKTDPSFTPEFKKVIDKALSVIMKHFNDNNNPPECSLTGEIIIDQNTGEIIDRNYIPFNTSKGTCFRREKKTKERK